MSTDQVTDKDRRKRPARHRFVGGLRETRTGIYGGFREGAWHRFQVLSMNPETITVKALQEHPGRGIIEVGEKRDMTLTRAVNYDSSLRDHFRATTLEELELPPTAMGREGKLPIFLVREETMVRQLQERLPAGYSVETDIGPKGYPQIWLLKPDD